MSDQEGPLINCNDCIKDQNITIAPEPTQFCFVDSKGNEIVVFDTKNREIRVSDDFDLNDVAREFMEIIRREFQTW